jgi:hypothetical protein
VLPRPSHRPPAIAAPIAAPPAKHETTPIGHFFRRLVSKRSADSKTWAIGFDTPQGRHEDHGKYVVAWKNFSGTWKAVADVFNSDVPVAG